MFFAGSADFQCHSIVLRAYSKFFSEIEQNLLIIELPPDKVTAKAFEFIYDWMLNTNAKVQRDGLMQVFIAAEYLKIDELIEQCWSCMDSSIHFNEDTAFALYLEAKGIENQVIPALMLPRISRFFLILVASKEFVEFTVDEVIALLSLSTIAVHSEAEVLFSAMRWLFFDWNTRKKDLIPVMECVRFGLISSLQLMEFTRGLNEDIQRIMENPEIHKMAADGLLYAITKQFYGEEDYVQATIERLELNEPNKRRWLEIEGEEKGMNAWLGKYSTFLDYLEMLKEKGVSYWKSFKFINDKECDVQQASSTSMKIRFIRPTKEKNK